MTENIKIIRNFISAWSNLDPDELVNYFTEDGIYYNMPIEPVQGKNNLKLFIQVISVDNLIVIDRFASGYFSFIEFFSV